MKSIDTVIDKFHKSYFLGRIFHTLNYCLQRELADCESVLDIGCGPSSPLQYCRNIKYSVGVEPFKPYLEESKKKKIHTKYINKRIEDLDFPEGSFDAVIMVDILEHLSKEEGKKLLAKAEKWANKKIIINTPNGFIGQLGIDNNPYQKHQSGWTYEEMKTNDFKCWGLAGLKILRKNKDKNSSMGDDLTVSIRFNPKIFWFLIATFSQIFTYYFPKYAFEIFCTKDVVNNIQNKEQ